MTYSPRSPQELEAWVKTTGVQVLDDLSTLDLNSSASTWTLRHLIAYRLLVINPGKEKDKLPIFDSDHSDCPVCNDTQSSAQVVDQSKVHNLIEGCPSNLRTRTEFELLTSENGFFWSALARAARSEQPDVVKKYPHRERTQQSRDSFVSSAVIDGSSPTTMSSSDYESRLSGSSHLDEDEHEERRGKPEQVTIQLVTSFLQHALNLCLKQENKIEVRPRIEPMTSVVDVAGDRAKFTAQDDGGICRMRRSRDGWEMVDSNLAIIEGKRSFKSLRFDNRSGKNVPIISNGTLAQYLGEAVATWASNINGNNDRNDLFMIASTSTFIRFIHYRFGSNYETYLQATNRDEQLKSISHESDSFVHMASTEQFNLESRRGRLAALCNLLSLLRWHIRHSSEDSMDVDGEEYQE